MPSCANGCAEGILVNRSRTQSRWEVRNSPACFRSHCIGSVTITARCVLLTLSVIRRAAGWRRTSTGSFSPCTSSLIGAMEAEAQERPMLIPFEKEDCADANHTTLVHEHWHNDGTQPFRHGNVLCLSSISSGRHNTIFKWAAVQRNCECVAEPHQRYHSMNRTLRARKFWPLYGGPEYCYRKRVVIEI